MKYNCSWNVCGKICALNLEWVWGARVDILYKVNIYMQLDDCTQVHVIVQFIAKEIWYLSSTFIQCVFGCDSRVMNGSQSGDFQ